MKKLFAFLALLVAWLAAPPLANAALVFYDDNYGTNLSGSGDMRAHMWGTGGDYESNSWGSDNTNMTYLGNKGYVYYYTPSDKTENVIFHKTSGGETPQYSVGDGKLYRSKSENNRDAGKVEIKLRGTPDDSNWNEYATLTYNSANGTFETDGFVTFNNVNLVTAGFNVYMEGNDRGWIGVSEINGPLTDQTMSPLGHMSVNLNGKYKLIIDFKNAHGSSGSIKLSVIPEEDVPVFAVTLGEESMGSLTGVGSLNLGRKPLEAGIYTVTATPNSGTPQTATFTVPANGEYDVTATITKSGNTYSLSASATAATTYWSLRGEFKTQGTWGNIKLTKSATDGLIWTAVLDSDNLKNFPTGTDKLNFGVQYTPADPGDGDSNQVWYNATSATTFSDTNTSAALAHNGGHNLIGEWTSGTVYDVTFNVKTLELSIVPRPIPVFAVTLGEESMGSVTGVGSLNLGRKPLEAGTYTVTATPDSGTPLEKTVTVDANGEYDVTATITKNGDTYSLAATATPATTFWSLRGEFQTQGTWGNIKLTKSATDGLIWTAELKADNLKYFPTGSTWLNFGVQYTPADPGDGDSNQVWYQGANSSVTFGDSNTSATLVQASTQANNLKAQWTSGTVYDVTFNVKTLELSIVPRPHEYNYKVKYEPSGGEAYTAIKMNETSDGVWETDVLPSLFDGTTRPFGIKLYDGDAEVNTGENWWSVTSSTKLHNANAAEGIDLVATGDNRVNPQWELDGSYKLVFNATTGKLTAVGTANTVSKVELYDGDNLVGELYNGGTSSTVDIDAPKEGKGYKVKLTRSDNGVRWFYHSGDINFNGEYDATQGEAVTTFKSLYSGKVGVTVDPTHLTVTKINLTDADKVIYLYKNDGSWNTNVGALTANGNNYVIDADLPDGKYFVLSTNPAAGNYNDLATAAGYVRYVPTNGTDFKIESAEGYTAAPNSESTSGAWQASAPYDSYLVSIAKDRSSMSILPYVHTLTLYKDDVAVTADTDVTGVTSATKFMVEDVVTLGGATTATKHYTVADAINTDGDIALAETDNASAAFSFDKDIYQFHFGGITRTTDGVTLAVSDIKREGFYPVEAGSASNENALVEVGTNGDIKQYRLLNMYDYRGTDQTRYFKPVVPAGSASVPRRVAGTTVPAGVYTEFTTVTSADAALLDINKNFVVTAEWKADGTPSRLSVVDPSAAPDLYFFGASHGWSSSDPLKFKYNPATNTYTLSVWVNNQGERGFKVATKKGTWDEVNSETYSYNDNNNNGDKKNTGGVGLNTDILLGFYSSATDVHNMYLPGDNVEYGDSRNDRLFTITISDLNPGVGAKMVVKEEEQKMFIYGSFNHTGDSNTGTAWSWDRQKMDYDSTTGLYTYTYTTQSSVNPFLFRLWNGNRDFAATDRDRTPLYDSYVTTANNNDYSFEVPSPGAGQKIVITFDPATNKVKSNVSSYLPDDVAYRALPVMPYVVRKSNAADQWSAWTNDQPVVYVLGKSVNDNRIVPDWELLPQGDGTYKLDNVNLRGLLDLTGDEAEYKATNIKALVIYKNQATAEEYPISFPASNGLETAGRLNYGRTYDLVYDNSTHQFTATPTAKSTELPFISLIGHSYRQQYDEMTPGGVTSTEGGWTEAWVLYGENKQPLRDLHGNYIYSTQWPPRNTIYFKAVRVDPTLGTISFDWPSDKLIFKPQRNSSNNLVIKDASDWVEAMHDLDISRYADLKLHSKAQSEDEIDENGNVVKDKDDKVVKKVGLVDGQRYARYVINDTWMLGATKIWTGWASTFFNNNGPYPEWGRHMNWGIPNSSVANADAGRTVRPYSMIGMVNGETTNSGNFFMPKPTYFKTVEFYLPVLEDGTPDREHVDNARFYTTLALAEAKIDAKADKIGESEDNNTGAFRVRYDQSKTSFTLQSWKVTRYSADLTTDMDDPDNWVVATVNDDDNPVLVYKSCKAEDEALGATIVTGDSPEDVQTALKTGLDATNSESSDYTTETKSLPNGRYFYGLEITFTDGTNTYKETIPSTIFTLTTLDAEPACTPLQLVLIKDNDAVRSNSTLKPYAGKYITYRPKRNGTYYIVNEADDTAEPVAASEASRIIQALLADPNLFTWTADYYVFAFDGSDYEESMTQALKAGDIVRYNKTPRVQIYDLPVKYNSDGSIASKPEQIAAMVDAADAATEGWLDCKKTNSTGYYGRVVKSGGSLAPLYYRGRVVYDYTVNEGDDPSEKVAAVNGSLRPTMAYPFGLKFRYVTTKSSTVDQSTEKEVIVATTSSILPELDENKNVVTDDNGNVVRRDVGVVFPWENDQTYFSPRDLNCEIEFIQPNVSTDIMDKYRIRYDIVISNDYTMADYYNQATGEWTVPTQLDGDNHLLYQEDVYFDVEKVDTGNKPYKFTIQNVSPTDHINPVFHITKVLYTDEKHADLEANYKYCEGQMLKVCYSEFNDLEAPAVKQIYLQARPTQLGGVDWCYLGHSEMTNSGSSEVGVGDGSSDTNTELAPSLYHIEAYIADNNTEGIMKRTDGAQNADMHLDLDYYYGGFREVMYHSPSTQNCNLAGNLSKTDPLIGQCLLYNAPADKPLEFILTPIYVYKRQPEGQAQKTTTTTVVGLVAESDLPNDAGVVNAPARLVANPADASPEYIVMRGKALVANTNDEDMFPGTTGLENLNGYDNAAPEYYNVQGMRITEPRAGEVYIVRRGAKVTKELMR